MSTAIPQRSAVGILGQDSSLWCPGITECLTSPASCPLNANSLLSPKCHIGGSAAKAQTKTIDELVLVHLLAPQNTCGSLRLKKELGYCGHEGEGQDCSSFVFQGPCVFICTAVWGHSHPSVLCPAPSRCYALAVRPKSHTLQS